MFIKISACSTLLKSWMWFLYLSLGSVTYSDFSKIMKREKVPSQLDLMSLFKKLDRNRKGFMTTSELKRLLMKVYTYTHIHVVMTACFERHNVNESACMYMWLMHVLKNKINVISVWNKRMLESCVMHVYTHTCTCKFLITALSWWNDGSKVIISTLVLYKHLQQVQQAHTVQLLALYLYVWLCTCTCTCILGTIT